MLPLEWPHIVKHSSKPALGGSRGHITTTGKLNLGISHSTRTYFSLAIDVFGSDDPTDVEMMFFAVHQDHPMTLNEEVPVRQYLTNHRRDSRLESVTSAATSLTLKGAIVGQFERVDSVEVGILTL